MGFSLHSTGCVKRAKECWNERRTINGSPRAAKTKEKLADVNRRASCQSFQAVIFCKASSKLRGR
jgi:hypothetical protein